MDYHQNARLTIHSRGKLARKVIEDGCTLKLAVASFNVVGAGVLLFKERVGPYGIAGIVLGMVSIVLLSL